MMYYTLMTSDAMSCLRMLMLLRSGFFFIVLLPSAPVNGSKLSRLSSHTYAACLRPAGVSHPDERISPLVLFSDFMADQTFIILSALIPPSTVLGYLRSGLVSEVSEKTKDTCAEISPLLELVTNPLPSVFLFLL